MQVCYNYFLPRSPHEHAGAHQNRCLGLRRTLDCPELQGMGFQLRGALDYAYRRGDSYGRTPELILQAWRGSGSAATASRTPAADASPAPCHLCRSSQHG